MQHRLGKAIKYKIVFIKKINLLRSKGAKIRKIYFNDGSAIRLKGSLRNTRILIMLCRDNALSDTSLFDAIVDSVSSKTCTLVWHEHSYKRSSKSFFSWCSKLFKKTPYQNRGSDIQFRCESLKKFIESLDPNCEISILSQSAGGRIASLICDELSIQKIVCLGYPFRGLHQPLEPERYLHLRTLRTPLLILQGCEDPYGTPEDIAQNFSLSSSIQLEFLDTDHEFILPEIETNKIIFRALDFLNLLEK